MPVRIQAFRCESGTRVVKKLGGAAFQLGRIEFPTQSTDSKPQRPSSWKNGATLQNSSGHKWTRKQTSDEETLNEEIESLLSSLAARSLLIGAQTSAQNLSRAHTSGQKCLPLELENRLLPFTVVEWHSNLRLDATITLMPGLYEYTSLGMG